MELLITIIFDILGFGVGCLVGTFIYRRWFMKKRWKHRKTVVTHIIYQEEKIKLEYPITFVETY